MDVPMEQQENGAPQQATRRAMTGRAPHRLELAISLAIGFLLALALPVGVDAARSGALAVVRASGAALHDAPSGTVIEPLARGAALEATGRTTDSVWLKVTAPGNKVGWTPAAQLVVFGVENLPVVNDWPSASPQTTAPREGVARPALVRITGIINTDGQGLNLRAGPGTGYAIVGARPPGQTLTLTGRNASADWLAALLPGENEIAWVAASFVRGEDDWARLPITDRVSAAAPIITPGSTSRTAAPTGLTGKLAVQGDGGQIHVFDLATGRTRLLTTGADPALSPDGQTVAFWRQDGGQHGLYVIGAEGGKERRVLMRPEKLRTPAWSPDGLSIAFSHVNGEDVCRDAGYGICLPDVFPYNRMFPAIRTDRWGLAAIDREGGSYRDIPTMPGAASPDWGPRGLLYAAAGIQATQDNGRADANAALLQEPRFRDPAWQPGGDRIAFQSLEKDHWEIFTAANDGGNPTALTRPATTLTPRLPQNVSPTWSPDGRSIAFLSDRSGRWAVWVMDAAGGNQRMLPIDAPIEYRNQGEQMLSWSK